MLRALAARRSAALPNFSRCMAEANAVIPAGRSISETSNSRIADKTAIRFLSFADAASPRTCGNDLLAVQRISPERPLRRSKLGIPKPHFRCTRIQQSGRRTLSPFANTSIAYAASFRTDGQLIAASRPMSPDRMVWIAPAPTGVAMRHTAVVIDCL